jgi:3-deoxy-manno-octulosonate cytidylyltransferase (CMP-KDO synthetase)
VHPVTFRNPFERTSRPLDIVVIIPARFDATRLPGKPLADIAGKPMIEHVYRRAAATPGVDAVVVATDDERIGQAVDAFGGFARMTRRDHRTGTDRLAEVAADLTCDVVLNVQGDEPLIEPATIQAVIEPLVNDPTLEMSTACTPLRHRPDYSSPNVVKVVRNQLGNALYFSRAPIPHFRAAEPAGAGPFKHLGIYGYRREFVIELAKLAQTPLELSESLEQLRVLEHGFHIHTAITPFDSIGVDTPEDLERVRQLMAAARA